MEFDSFDSFYPFYLSQHRHPMTRALHVLGLIVVFSLIAVSVWTRLWWILALIPFAGYGPAWVGHFFFEKNRPATFRHPFYSLWGDFVMFKDIVTRKKLTLIALALLLPCGSARAQETLETKDTQETQSYSSYLGTETARLSDLPLEVTVRYTITNNGVDVEGRGVYAIYPAGKRNQEIGHANSGYEARIPAGTYDVAIRYRDGTIKKEVWLKQQAFDGPTDQTVEVNVVPAEVVLKATRFGQPATSADCALYATGQKTDPVARLAPGEAARVAEGLYDASCVYIEQDLSVEQWQLNQVVSGKKEIAFVFDFKKATFRVIDPPTAAPPVSSLVQIFPAGKRDRAAARGVIGTTLSFPAGVYDVLLERDGKAATWLGVTIEGEVSVPFLDAPPASTLKNVTISPETLPETIPTPQTLPTMPETKPAVPPPTTTPPTPPPTGPNGLPLPPSLTNVPAAPVNWHGWFGCSLVR